MSADQRTGVLVLGYGVTGQAVVEHCVAQHLPVAVSEHNQLSDDQLTELRELGVPFEQGGHTTRFLKQADTLVLSPGIRPQHPLIEQAKQHGVQVVSELDWAWTQLPGCKTVAVTGTNGKSSTVQAITALLEWAGYRAQAVGNIGLPLTAVVSDTHADDVLVIEVSSYQLELSELFRPDVAVLLNLTPDHLARHSTLEAYAQAKGRLFEHQTASDVAILPRDLADKFNRGAGRRVFYDEASVRWPNDVRYLHPHERLNLRAALLAVHAIDPFFDNELVPADVLLDAFRMPHRMERLGCVGDVAVVNDSKSTNAASTIAAIDSVAEPIVLLLGGQAKLGGYDTLREKLSSRPLRGIVTFGAAGEVFEHLLESIESPVYRVDTLQQATSMALAMARPADTVLLSPACASFDQFDSFEHRGNVFSAFIRALPGFKPEADQGRAS